MAFSVSEAVGVFFNKNPTSIGKQPAESTTPGDSDSQFKRDSLILDASVSEVHTTSSTITDHPVETGANITDHVHKNPDTLVITGIVTNTPTRFPEGIISVPVFQAIERTFAKNVTNDLARTAYDKLRDLVNNKELVKIVTNLRTYENMLIEEFSVNRDFETADALAFTMRLREVRIVKTTAIERPLPANPQKTTAKKVSKGKQPTPAGPVYGPEEAPKSFIFSYANR